MMGTKNLKTVALAALAGLALGIAPCALAEAVSVTGVVAQQRYPWNGLVDIGVSLAGPADVVASADFTFAATNSATAAAVPVTCVTRDGADTGSGTAWTRRYVWDAAQDAGVVQIDDLALTVVLKSHAVSFSANGKTATGMPPSQTVSHGANATVPASTPTATGYTFNGWYTTSACTTPFDFANTAITQDTTIYAGWTPVSYTISYTLSGGTASNPTSYTIESNAITLNNPTRAGYTFTGWTGTGLSAKTMTVTIPKGSTGNRSYTATWVVNSVQLWSGGPYFATRNVGASLPQDYGYYFWWGDTIGYKRNAANTGWISSKDGSAFSFTEAACPTFGKNNLKLQEAGYIDSSGDPYLNAAHDAATVHWGSPWRMMTYAEFQKLADTSYCTWTWTSNWDGTGVAGYVVRGAKSGYTDKSIFLPAAGYGSDSDFKEPGVQGFCRSSTPYSSITAWALKFTSSEFGEDLGPRSTGFSIRPVRSTN